MNSPQRRKAGGKSLDFLFRLFYFLVPKGKGIAEMSTSDVLLTRAEVAVILKVCPQTLNSWCMAQKHLPTIKIGDRAVRYRRSDVDELIKSRTRPVAGL